MTDSLVAVMQESAARCAWGLLGSVGMSSASGAPARHSVSPEDALVIASIASAADSRLRDEARDWFVTFDDLISRPVLKHRLGLLGESAIDHWRSFTAPLAPWVRGRIPSAEPGNAHFEPSGKSQRTITRERQYGRLRCRAIFGTQARADVIFQLASEGDGARGWTADALARRTGYTKSAVREALDRLVEGDIVRRARVGNADWFSLANADHLCAVLGDLAMAPVDTTPVARVYSLLLTAAMLLDSNPDPAVFVRARAMLEPLQRDLDDLRAQLPGPTHDFEHGRRELREMLLELAARLADPTRPLWPW